MTTACNQLKHFYGWFWPVIVFLRTETKPTASFGDVFWFLMLQFPSLSKFIRYVYKCIVQIVKVKLISVKGPECCSNGCCGYGCTCVCCCCWFDYLKSSNMCAQSRRLFSLGRCALSVMSVWPLNIIHWTQTYHLIITAFVFAFISSETVRRNNGTRWSDYQFLRRYVFVHI